MRAGVPFRQSHHLVGQVVRRAEELGCALRALPLADLQAINPAFPPRWRRVWDFERSVEQRIRPRRHGALGGAGAGRGVTQLIGLSPDLADALAVAARCSCADLPYSLPFAICSSLASRHRQLSRVPQVEERRPLLRSRTDELFKNGQALPSQLFRGID